jgi:hypothetical protein
LSLHALVSINQENLELSVINGLTILVLTGAEKKETLVFLNNGLNHQLAQKYQLLVQNSVKTCNI